MTKSRRLLPALLLGVVLGCGDGSGVMSVNTPPVNVSGVIRDYFSTAPLASVLVTVDDHPTLTTTSGTVGGYTFSISGSTTLRVVTALNNYRPTRNETLTIGTSAVMADQFAIALADINRQYTAVGLIPTINTGVVIVNLRDSLNQPRVGIPIADIVLRDAAQMPVGRGPYVFGAAGDIVSQAQLSVTAAFNGRSRVAFLDVPGGTYTLAVTVPGPQTLTASVIVTANGVTLVQR